MSEINVNTIKKADGTGSLTVPAESGTVVTTASSSLGRRNLIINGAMQVAQRGTSVSLSNNTNEGYNSLDRWRISIGSNGAATISQSTDAPDGFGYSYKAEVTTAISSVASGDFVQLLTRLEGQNLQQFKKGTASAESMTLSFWVKTDVTGTYPVNFRDTDNNRSVSGTYTVNSADTWEYKTITVVGDTSGAFDNDNNSSFQLQWWLVAGSTYSGGTLDSTWATRVTANDAVGQPNVFSTIGNYWQITGVQLEVGSVATPFEHRSYGEELALCQRYYEKSFNTGDTPVADAPNYPDRITVIQYASSTVGGQIRFQTTKRASPSITLYCGGNINTPSNATGSIAVYSGGWAERIGSSNRQSEAEYSIDIAHSGTIGQTLISEFGWVADAEL